MAFRWIAAGLCCALAVGCSDDGGPAADSSSGDDADTGSLSGSATTLTTSPTGGTSSTTSTGGSSGTTSEPADGSGGSTGSPPMCQEDEDCVEVDGDLCTIPACDQFMCIEEPLVCPSGCTDGICNVDGVVISELLYDESGPDFDVFIELYGPPGFDLAGMTLEAVNGSDGSVYASLDLTGNFIPADNIFLIVSDSAFDVNLLAEADLLDPIADLQNGPDNLRLVMNATPVDAVGYGLFGGGFFVGEGNPSVDANEGNSLARVGTFSDTDDNSVDFFEDVVPTPGALNN